jgi:hypothetical protein
MKDEMKMELALVYPRRRSNTIGGAAVSNMCAIQNQKNRETETMPYPLKAVRTTHRLSAISLGLVLGSLLLPVSALAGERSQVHEERVKAQAKYLEERTKAHAKALEEDGKAQAKWIEERAKGQPKWIEEREKARAKAIEERAKADAKGIEERGKARAKAIEERAKFRSRR